MARSRSRFKAALAARAVEHVVQERRAARVGRPRLLGRGLENAAYLVDIEQLGPDGEDHWEQVVARVPHRVMSEEGRQAAGRERRLLARLADESLAFRAPEVLGLVALEGRLVMVQTACHGASLPARARGTAEPWTAIASAAASLHAVDITRWPEDAVGPHVSRREHVVTWSAEVSRGAPARFEEALGFVAAHLPPDEPGALLHGDLLPQNLRIDPMNEEPPAVLDWSCARVGDPAHDLAIVTRGVRRPFGVDAGARLLLDAYNSKSVRPILPVELRVHELLLHLGFHAQLPDEPAYEFQRTEAARLVEGLLRRSLA